MDWKVVSEKSAYPVNSVQVNSAPVNLAYPVIAAQVKSAPWKNSHEVKYAPLKSSLEMKVVEL